MDWPLALKTVERPGVSLEARPGRLADTPSCLVTPGAGPAEVGPYPGPERNPSVIGSPGDMSNRVSGATLGQLTYAGFGTSSLLQEEQNLS